LTSLNIPKGDEGGELDPHGADGNGNPVGGLVFSSAFGTLEQLHEWTVRFILTSNKYLLFLVTDVYLFGPELHVLN
jgi:hypothetical protein